MSIHTEYMSFNNRWSISSSYHFQPHQQHSQKQCCFSETALLWVKVLPGLSPAYPCAPRLVVSAPRHVTGAPRCCQVHPQFSLALRSVPKPITKTPMVHQYQSLEIHVTLKTGMNALLGYETLLKLTNQSLNSTSTETLLEASSD